MTFPICSECKKFCKEVRRNFGIGSYEFWGATGSQDNWQWVSHCCDGDLVYELEEETDGLDCASSGLE